jgi:hypothetical protein
MENIGGKTVIFYLLVFLLSSCDMSVPISINNGKDMRIDTDCGKITLASSKFGGLILFGQKFEGSFWVQPDSLKIEFSPKVVGMKDLICSMGGEDRKNIDGFHVNNDYVTIHFKIFSETPVNLDTVTMLVLPCDYILCNDKPLLTDTIRICLKGNR